MDRGNAAVVGHLDRAGPDIREGHNRPLELVILDAPLVIQKFLR
jgi:hypothetical protein